MTRLAPVLALLLGACAPTVGVQIHASHERMDWAIEEIDRAADAGLPVYPDADGPLHIVVVEDWETDYAGLAISKMTCARVAVIQAGSPQYVVAHEVGHLLGLSHSKDPHNIMYKNLEARSVELKEKQIRKAERAARNLTRCSR